MKAKQAEAAQQQAWTQRLMAMSFTTPREWFLLVLACLMAGINGAIMPIFSIVFTEMLQIFFLCVPLPMNETLCACVFLGHCWRRFGW